MPVLNPDKDRQVVLAFFEAQHKKGLALLERPEEDLFYEMQDWYSLLFKAIRKAFRDPDDLITRLNYRVAYSHTDPTRTRVSCHERIRDHLATVEYILSELEG